MVIIACLAQNTAVGMMVGSFGTLVESVEAKMGVDRELSSLGLEAYQRAFPCAGS
jgi:hypothetical protein